MGEKRRLSALLVLATLLCSLNLFLYLSPQKQTSSQEKIISQSTYFGPTSSVPGNPELIKVEVLIHDSPKLSGVQIQSVVFNGQAIPLKPRDIFGKRGEASFQLPPGTYSLRWTVQRDKLLWPRTLSFSEEVILDAKDLWVQILIEGEEVSIR